MSDFDGVIERELNRVLGPVDAQTIPAWRTPASGGFMKRILGGTGAAVAAKLLTGFAVVAFAAAGAGAATEAAITGSLNPLDWGQQVKQTVATCKDTLRASGVRGIGPCVSAFARQNGQNHQNSHASDARTNGKGHDKGNGKDKGNSNGKGNGNGQPSDKAHGKPSTVPPTRES
jgi:hypothetical protein